MIVTFGALFLFLAVVIGILQRSFKADRSFTDYAVGGRSFSARYQMMSFLNTWYPGAMFTAFAGMAASAGVISFYVLAYSLATVVLMYWMAKPVWRWGQQFQLHTQPDLFALRYDCRHIRSIAALIGIVSSFPWLVLAMQAMGVLFHEMSFEKIPFSDAVILGVVVIALRQIWTIRMGMRGVVISDMFQGIVAYLFGGCMLLGLIVWLVMRGASLTSISPSMFSLPGVGSKEGPFFLFSLLFTGTIGGWCLPFVFVRLFTADGVDSLKKSAAMSMPISLVFCTALLLFGMLASGLPAVAAHPENVWFIVSQQAGGTVLLAAAGVVLLAATIGHTDGSIQSTGAQIANDLIGNYADLDPKQLVLVSKIGMVILTLLAAWVASMNLPALFTLAVLAYQGIIQLAVPQFLGLFWSRGNKQGAIAGMLVGFCVVAALEFFFPHQLSMAWGLSSGVIAMSVNLVIYVALAYAMPQSRAERARVLDLFKLANRSASGAVAVPNSTMADLPPTVR